MGFGLNLGIQQGYNGMQPTKIRGYCECETENGMIMSQIANILGKMTDNDDKPYNF